MTFQEAINHPSYAYARRVSWRLDGWVKDESDYVIRVYHRNPASPSGVTLAASHSVYHEAKAMLDAAGKSFYGPRY